MRCLFIGLICLIATAGIADAKLSYIRAFKEGDKHEGSVIVKELDDPVNPYKDQYTDYDRWAFEHYNSHITLENHSQWQMGLDAAQGAHHFHDDRPDMPRWDPERALWLVYTVVDKDGFVIPHLWRDPEWNGQMPVQTVRQNIESSRDKWAPDPAGFWSLGRMPLELQTRQDAAWKKLVADTTAVVAEWMVAKNRDAVMLPDGGAIFITDARLVPDAKNGKWLMERYAADGTLVRSVESLNRHTWEDVLTDKNYDRKGLYFKKYPHTRATGEVSYSNNLFGLGRYKMYMAERGSNPPVLALIDVWEDRFYSIEQDGPDFIDKLTIDWRYWRVIDSTELARIYLAQQGQL
ncbi:MAG: hypothetical protein M3R04_00130 [bacterium]|nr:hypothetical protein [bacterium]